MVCHPSRTYLPKELGQEPQNRSPPISPPPNHTPLPLTHDPTKSHIGWVQVGGAWALCVLSLHVCPRSACHSCICRGLEACLHGLLLFFILFCGLFYNSLPTLGAGLPLILGFTFLPPIPCLPSCSAIVSCHSCCNDLILLGPFGLAVYSFPNGLTRPWAFLSMGSCVPFSLGHP